MVLLCGTVVLLWLSGVLLPNVSAAAAYPVRGVDVSSYQGNIDWEALSEQDIDFAFLKATEGSSMVDECFAGNWEGAGKTGLRVGAYHFFSYDSPGETQADNFIRTVKKAEGMLPPVVDVEFYGDKERNLPEREAVTRELTALLQRLEAHYGQKPILYATEKSYRLFLSDAYKDCDIWIRNVLSAPSLSDGREWVFWQYTDRMRLEGYDGVERFIDMNVFQGSQEEFARYGNNQ